MTQKSFSCKSIHAAGILRVMTFFTLPLCGILVPGCAPYRISTPEFVDRRCRDQGCGTLEEEQKAARHWLYGIVPRHRCQIRCYDVGHWTTWALFGNDDDGLFGEASTSRRLSGCEPGFCRALWWQLRNPLHNFCFYVAGQAESINDQFVLLNVSGCRCEALSYHCEAESLFPEEGSCFTFAFHGGKPFVGLRLRFSRCWRSDLYLGWRERGNFGIKIPIPKQVEG